MNPIPNASTRAAAANTPNSLPVPPPWWHEPTMWLVVGGPSTVVVAALATAFIAVRGADPIVMDPPRLGAASPADFRTGTTPLTPAVQARNHAATPAQ